MSKPLALSDEQLTIIMNVCAPLQPHERSALLAKVAEHLRGAHAEIGPGGLHRLVRDLLRPIWRPPSGITKEFEHRRNIGPPIE